MTSSGLGLQKVMTWFSNDKKVPDNNVPDNNVSDNNVMLGESDGTSDEKNYKIIKLSETKLEYGVGLKIINGKLENNPTLVVAFFGEDNLQLLNVGGNQTGQPTGTGFIKIIVYLEKDGKWKINASSDLNDGYDYRNKKFTVPSDEWFGDNWDNSNSPLKITVEYISTLNETKKTIYSTVYYSGGFTINGDDTLTETGNWFYIENNNPAKDFF